MALQQSLLERRSQGLEASVLGFDKGGERPVASILKHVKRLAPLAAALTLALAAYAALVLLGLPPRSAVRALARSNPGQTGVMRQREEEARRSRRVVRHVQVWVPLSRISRSLIEAVVVAEDPKFFGHEGFDFDALKESVETDLEKRTYVRGGSTLTQQLAKNLFFTTHKSVTRKLRELVVTRWLESDLPKKRILELYLNVIEWGDGLYGCEAAAESYFDTSAAELSEEQAAGLAAMIPSPKRINPRTNPAWFAKSQRRVLALMAHGSLKRAVGSFGATPPAPPEETGPDAEDKEPEPPR